MKTNIPALRRARAKRVDDLGAILAAANGEDRAFTDEERSQIDALKAAIAADDERIALAEMVEQENIEDAAAATPLHAPSAEDRAASGGGLRVSVSDNAEDKPWGETNEQKFGAFLKAVKHAEEAGLQSMDPRLRRHMSTVVAASGSNEQIGSEGAFLVGQELTAFINQRIFEVGILPSRCEQFILPPGVNKVSLKFNAETSRAVGSLWGGLQVFWRAEADTVTAKKPKVREVDAKLESLMGIYYDTSESEEDSIIGQIALRAFPDAIAHQLDADIFKGHGAGKPAGFSVSSGRVTQAKETGQAAGSLYSENIINMWSRMPMSSRLGAIWLIGTTTEPALHQLVFPTDSLNPTPMYMGPGRLADSPYGTIYGRPVIPFEHCSALGTEGDIVLVDPRAYLLLTNGRGAVPEMSIHVRFLYNENTYRWVTRVNGLPMLATPFTAADGSTTVSPYVTVATRS